MAERDGGGNDGYGDWRSLELAIKDAAKKAARQAGPGISAACGARLLDLASADFPVGIIAE